MFLTLRIRTRSGFRGAGRLALLLALAAGLLTPPVAHAAGFQIREQNPMTLIYGLPLMTDPELPGLGQKRFYGSLNVSNTLHTQSSGTEHLLLDGETYVLNLLGDVSVGPDWAVGLHIPFISHQGGRLDSTIEDFHDAFALPQGNRLKEPRNRLLFSYQNRGRQLVWLNHDASGLGDVSVRAARRLSASPARALSLWSQLKLPTGDSDKLMGSGGADLALWLAGRGALGSGWDMDASAGVLGRGRGNVAPAQQRSPVPFGSLGVAWRPWALVSLRVQLDAHGALYQDSSAQVLGDSYQLTMGGTLHLAQGWALDLAIGEDVKVESAPDVHFHAALRRVVGRQ